MDITTRNTFVQRDHENKTTCTSNKKREVHYSEASVEAETEQTNSRLPC